MPMSAKPIDPRLLRHASAARGYLVLTVVLGLAGTGLILAQAGLLARLLAGAATGIGVAVLAGPLIALALVLAGRAATSWGGEVAALRAAATVKSQLRRQLIDRLLRRSPAPGPGAGADGELATLATRGLDGLDAYFARYLPQLVLAVLVPLAVLIRVALADWLSALIIAVTLPLVPVFAVLVGLSTRARTRRQWALLARLGGHFLDVVEGLPTLKIFGQGRRQAEIIARVTDEHRRATMSTLRQAFLSALVLDLAATLATALVAVEVGLRLLGGHIGYQSALLILLLTPEVYLPLRAVGTFYHASMGGAAAGGRAFEILETAPAYPAITGKADGSAGSDAPADSHGDAVRRGSGRRPGAPDLRRDEIRMTSVTVAYPGRASPALDELSLCIEPGEKVMICGPSGAGKSSLLAALLRFIEPASGRIQAGSLDIGALVLRAWREQIAWVPQQPYLFSGTVRDNIALGCPDASMDAIAAAAQLAGAGTFIDELPAGYGTLLGERGLQLSAGQRQRLALARAFHRGAPLLLLDEPTAHLDTVSAAELRVAVGTAMKDRTIIVVTHDQNWARNTGRVVALADSRVVSDRAAGEQVPLEASGLAGDAGPAEFSTVTR